MSEKEDGFERMLSYKPVHIRRLASDPFFDEGNYFCGYRKQTVVQLDEEDLLHKSVESFQCRLGGCQEYFDTLHSFEVHYGSCHRFVCALCRHIFPSNHILDLHVIETHDTLFQLMASKKPMYHCLIETCCDRFSSPAKRKHHLIAIHQYPVNFQFEDLLSTPNIYQRDSHVRLNVKSHAIQEKYAYNNEPSKMDVAVNTQTDIPPTKIKYICRVPGSICFGMGSTRSFKLSKHKKMTNIGMDCVSEALQEAMDEDSSEVTDDVFQN